jgi:RNA polymerase sigma-70 factor (ECF subfamily)
VTVPVAIVTPLTPSAAGHKAIAPADRVAPRIQRLTGALADGNETAFREFHSAYFDRLLRYLFVVTRGDEEAAREALQETFTRVVRHIRQFDSEDAFWNWLTVLARSSATDAGRKRTRYWRMLARYAFFWESAKCDTADDASDNLEALLAQSLDVLDPGERTLIENKYFRGASVRTLATEMQLTEKAVESRLARARRRLREELSKRLRDEERH